ncbi:MAG: DNA repair exonuclease, partial [Candidatus Acidiferrales bacterium]
LVNRISRAIEKTVADESGGRLVACRIELTGRTGLHDYIVSSREHLTAEARASALALGDEAAWPERLVISTEPLADNSLRSAQSAPDDFATILGEAADDPGLRAQLETEIGDLVRKLPHEIRSETEQGILKAAAGGDYPEVANEASRYLSAQLAGD